ncbi:unnamed protein product [Penicillium salamii]|uniref:Major facilitator superfamily (MFS) profile domain-containing protein n=1 Tax=Penicillium salamii TaxID=1612424 RepID=A0A9W4NZE2_9EURO|nr:unnamed protein product [Penicillium salamii]CAG7954742.1 unnamed protein product [Penicillium salamii]CAG7972989.1 unnamed protein product [Penicillium salamii]CAG8128419.1 unnamed protein product [Penicillium salamii]CAG8137792.1 unnamed protein product [Penicillium salamii]
MSQTVFKPNVDSTSNKADLESQPTLITFSENDPENPLNWPRSRKWAITLVVSLSVFLMPLSSSIVAPELSTIRDDLRMGSSLEAVLVLSTFVLTYCLGPLILGPLSEIYGRVVVLHFGNSFYLVFNLVCGFARNKGELLAFRVLAGFGGAGGLVVSSPVCVILIHGLTYQVGAGIISDCFSKEERGWVIAIYNLGPVFGPSIGAVIGGFITQYTTWRWAFWATSIFDGALIILGLIVMKETYPPIILARRKQKLSTPNQLYTTPYEKPDQTLTQLYRNSLLRPLHLLRVQPIIQLLALFYAYLYGLMYLVLSTFTTLWQEKYHLKTGPSSLHYLALGIGYFLGSQICGLLVDPIYKTLKGPDTGKPEYRIILMFPASILAPIGLLWYGWAGQTVTHWIVPDLGIALFAAAAMVSFQCTTAYLYEAFTLYAASATGAVYILRALTGFGFPLFGPAMYRSLDFGWGTTVVALVAVVLGVPAPVVLWRFGERLRARSDFAVG